MLSGRIHSIYDFCRLAFLVYEGIKANTTYFAIPIRTGSQCEPIWSRISSSIIREGDECVLWSELVIILHMPIVKAPIKCQPRINPLSGIFAGYCIVSHVLIHVCMHALDLIYNRSSIADCCIQSFPDRSKVTENPWDFFTIRNSSVEHSTRSMPEEQRWDHNGKHY
jgi:hypothetical protein